MFDYSKQIESFRDKKVRLSTDFKEKLYEHRDANRDRLISRLPDRIEGLSVSTSSFKPQGSMAVDLIIQTKFKYEEYDIDDGLVLKRSELKNEESSELTSDQVRDHVLQALKDKRFVKQPQQVSNAVRVFYKECDEERHHVDFPVYRKYENEDGQTIQELASVDGWMESDPTQVTRWFLDEVTDRNKSKADRGSQMRQQTQLLKRFCRSRNNWDLPNGMKLTMLVAECQPAYSERIDEAFRTLLENIKDRLENDKTIRNLAHPDQPLLTRSNNDANVVELADRIDEALGKLELLDDPGHDNIDSARSSWDWVFRSDGFFLEYDQNLKEKVQRLQNRAALLNSGQAKTSTSGVIGLTGMPNQPHRFYGDHDKKENR